MSKHSKIKAAPEMGETPVTTEIMRHMARGATNDQLFSFLCFQEPWLNAHPVVEMRQQANHSNRHVPYDKEAHEQLMNLINVCRSNYKRELKRRKHVDEVVGETDVLMSLADIVEKPVLRHTSGYIEIDKVLGATTRYNERTMQPVSQDWGYPMGMALLLAGAKGVGKTKFLIDQCIKLTEDFGETVLYFQKEMKAEQFKAAVMNSYRANGRRPTEAALRRFIVRGDRNYQDCCRLIKKVKPVLVIFDSFNMLHGSKTQQGIEDIVFFIKDAIGEHTCCVMIAHMNKRGGFKGPNDIEYLTDANFLMNWAEEPEDADEAEELAEALAAGLPSPFKNRYKLYSDKNREGERGITAYCKHAGTRTMVLPEKKKREKVQKPEEDDREEGED